MATALRTTARLNEAEAALVQKLRTGGSDESLALHALTNTAVTDATNAEAVHALIEAGMKAIEEKTEEIGYARQAQFEATHPDCVAWRTTVRTHGLRLLADAYEDGAA